MDDAVKTLLDNGHYALLVIDKQNGYAYRPATATRREIKTERLQAMLPRLDSFIRAVRKRNIPVVWTQMIENSAQSPDNIAFKIRSDGDYPLTISGEKSFEFAGQPPEPQEKVIVKKHYDAFTDTGLHEFLQAAGIRTVILTGAYASRCVLATAFAANGLGYNVIVVEDMIANADDYWQELESALSITRLILGFVVSSDDLVNYLRA